MALEKTDEDSNSAFFADKNSDLGGGGNPNSMTSELEKQHAEDPGSAVGEEEEKFVIVNEEDVPAAGEEGADDTAAADEEDKTPLLDPNISGLLNSIEGLTQIQRDQIAASQAAENQPAEDPEPEPDYTDPESVRAWTEWQTRESNRQVAQTLEKYHTDNVAPLQGIALNRENQSQIADAKTAHGDRFDWKRDEADIRKLQEASPTLTVGDAFRHLDYSRLVQEGTNAAEKKAELANSATVGSGPASAAKGPDPTTLVATKEDRKMAQNFGMSLKAWMKSKHAQEQESGGSLI